MFAEVLRKGSKAYLPYAPFLPPKLADAPRAPQDPVRKSGRGGAQMPTSLSNTGQLGLRDSGYTIAGENAGARNNLGILGAMLTCWGHRSSAKRRSLRGSKESSECIAGPLSSRLGIPPFEKGWAGESEKEPITPMRHTHEPTEVAGHNKPKLGGAYARPSFS